MPEANLVLPAGRAGQASPGSQQPSSRSITEPEFSTFGFRDGKLAVVESVNRAGDHAAAKRIIGTTKTLMPEDAADLAFDLRGLAKR
jgi:3-phenylpropionate/trans-cinnamate dioxygenase ferredoxin reductase component